MKCVDKKYINLHPEDGSNFHNYQKFEGIPTLTDYIFSPIGASMDVLDHYDNVVFMLWEEPNCFWVPTVEQRLRKNYHKIKKVLSNCPYSTEYWNNIYGDDKRICGFNHFNVENIPTDFTKHYDVYFTGHVFFDFVGGMVNVAEKFNNRIVSFNYGNHRGATFREKLQFNANSKVSIVFNCLYETSGIKMDELHPTNKAFSNLKKNRFIPQVKTRTLEAAACKSIMLCHFEEFRIVETMFTPDKDFIYWYNFEDLEEKINEVLKNYEKYTHLADHAYETLVNNWTTYHFFEKYLRNL